MPRANARKAPKRKRGKVGSAPRSAARAPADLLTPAVHAATAVTALHVSLPMVGRVGSGTRRVLRAALARWSDLLQQAGAPALPPSRAVEEPVFVNLGQDEEGEESAPAEVTPLPLQQYSQQEIEATGEAQGTALTSWVEAAGASWRARGREVARAFRAVVSAVERRVRQLTDAARDASDSVTADLRAWLHRWAEGAMQVHRDMMAALGRAAWGAGFGLVLVGALYLWSKKRG